MSTLNDDLLFLRLTILQGSGLVAKDRNLRGQTTTSDPYVEVWSGTTSTTRRGRTQTRSKTLDPQWNQSFDITIRKSDPLILKIYDEDLLTADDLMGTVTIPGPFRTTASPQWHPVDPNSANRASGRVQIQWQVLQKSRALMRGNDFPLAASATLHLGLAWDLLDGHKCIDLDASLVAISHSGQFLMSDSVYYGKTSNANRSVRHSGDEREGDEVGDDEVITLQLPQVPSNVLAFYLILSVATVSQKLSDIQSARVTVREETKTSHTTHHSSAIPLCHFVPSQHAFASDATTLFLVRIARNAETTWTLSPLQDTHPTARDFGTLIPHCKAYTQDLLSVPITIDPTERVAILRKGGTIRLIDYCAQKQLPDTVRFGLAWDVTDGVNIDLDASAICLDAHLNCVDTVYFRQLRSKDGSIRHHGDEREGDAVGDDEKLDICFSQVNEQIEYIGFVINSYSGQELDDVARASCHLFDPSTGTDIASYAMTNASALNGYTALLVACLRRNRNTPHSTWELTILGEAAQGRTADDNVDELQNCLRRHPPVSPPVEEEEIDLADLAMPEKVPLPDEEEIDLSSPVS